MTDETIKPLPKKLKAKLAKKVANAETIKTLEAENKDLSDEIAAYMLTHDLKRALGDDGLRVTYCEGKSTRIDKKRLLAAGVSADTIVKATVVTPYTYIQTQKPKGD